MERLNSRQILKKLKKEGWIERNTTGSHVQLKHKDFKYLITVPHPKRDFPIGTLRDIYKNAGWL